MFFVRLCWSVLLLEEITEIHNDSSWQVGSEALHSPWACRSRVSARFRALFGKIVLDALLLPPRAATWKEYGAAFFAKAHASSAILSKCLRFAQVERERQPNARLRASSGSSSQERTRHRTQRRLAGHQRGGRCSLLRPQRRPDADVAQANEACGRSGEGRKEPSGEDRCGRH